MVKARLLEIIRDEGPIPFERFMEIALYGEGGFFASDRLRSVKSGDFLTSPEVSALFGETLSAFVHRERERIGDPFRVVEVAGGSGSLIRSLLAAPIWEGEPPPVWAVEASPAARRAIGDAIDAERVVESLGDLPSPIRGVMLANELVDNLPTAIAQLTQEGWRERWVGAAGERLELVDALVRPDVAAWLERFAGPVEVGGWVEVQLAAGAWLREAIGLLEAGALVLIDYGETAENLAPRRAEGTLRTYRAHHLGPHPLDEPGATDITSDVNFTALEAIAREEGAEVELWRQDDFLAELGLRRLISELRHRELEFLREGEDMERLKVRSIRTEAETLLHPRGLGDFRVLVARVS